MLTLQDILEAVELGVDIVDSPYPYLPHSSWGLSMLSERAWKALDAFFSFQTAYKLIKNALITVILPLFAITNLPHQVEPLQ